ncbi:zf-HC2 domain-containing protein [Archangium violaceum]|uniref:anti-sigma factor family protein n=1 Tax=Archangium violaceum TaxID=83451 RepID=UPI00194DC58C|nr:zf-HC2 domain-containing protein [Archangium violaceum]QRO00348.1 zf-HC2 domain-containing protein [Archangium violaceum]
MATCRDYEESLTLHASGALEPGEEARVRAHLESCAACRDEVEALREVLSLAALPPPSAREETVLEALPRTTVSRWRGTQVQQAARMRTAGALLALAAAVLLVLGPVVRQRTAVPTPPSVDVELPDSPAEEAHSALEEWALADPLAEALDLSEAQPEELQPGDEVLDSELDDFLSSPNPGDSL